MLKKGQSKLRTEQDTPYRRIVLLAVGLVVVILAFFMLNLIARGFGGDEKKLATALFNTLKEPYINGQISLAQKSQTNTFDVNGSFHTEKLSKIALDAVVKGELQNQRVELPVKFYSDSNKDTMYVQLSGMQSMVDMISTVAPILKPDFAAISEKIDGKWLQLQQKKDNSATTCGGKMLAKLTDDKSVTSSLVKIYSKSRFLKVEKVEAAANGARDYTVSVDSDSVQSFIKEVTAIKAFTSIEECKDVLKTVNSAENSQTQTQEQTAGAEKKPVATQVVTVKDDKIVGLASTDMANNQVNTNKVSLSFDKGAPLHAPTEGIVEYKEIESNIVSLGGIFRQQMQQVQQNPQQSGAM